MPYPASIPVIFSTSLPLHYYGPFSKDADTRYYFGFRDPDGFVTALKSVDRGETWAEADAANAFEPYFLSLISVVPHKDWPTSSDIIYVFYLNPSDELLHVIEFDTGTDTWGADVASAKGFSDLSMFTPTDQANSWYAAYRPDNTIVIFGSFDAEDVLPVGPVWRVGYMIYDVASSSFGSYSVILSTGGETDSWLTVGAASGASGKTHLVYLKVDAAGNISLRQSTLDEFDNLQPEQIIFTNPTNGIVLFDWFSHVQSREVDGATQIYFTQNRGTVDGDISTYVPYFIFANSADEPVWNETAFRGPAVYNGLTNSGVLYGQIMAFGNSEQATVFWVQETWSAGSLVSADMRAKATESGFVFGSENIVFDDLPAGYGGSASRSAGMVTEFTQYGISLTLIDTLGSGPLLNYYWEFPALTPPSPVPTSGSGGIGGGSGGWWTYYTSISDSAKEGRLIKKFKLPSKEPNIYDCCLERFAKLMASRVQDIKPVCILDDVLGRYTFPRLGEEFWKRGAIDTPQIADGDVTVLEMVVPAGYSGLIYGLSCGYSGPGFTDGAGDIEWRLRVGPVYPTGFGRVIYQLGSPEQPLQLTDHIRVRSGQRIRWIVRVVGAGIVSGTTKVTCSIQGWFHPRMERR